MDGPVEWVEETSSGLREVSIPGYRLEGFIGRGGMGEVHRATQLSLERLVAIKLLSPKLASDETFVARFEKEAAALAALSHPNIVAIVDKGATSFTYYLVMEHVSGPSLRERMASGEQQPLATIRLFLDICRGVEHAHRRGIIHRDLKPENILIDEQAGGAPKVSDFGLASFIDGREHFHLTATNIAMGTLAYMAPEQRLNAKEADHRADIYSLGVLLYELLVGELPIGAYKPPSERRSLDPRIDPIVLRALELDPAARYPTLAEMIADLEALLPSMPTLPSRPVTKLERATLTARRVVRRIAIGLAILTVAGSLVMLGVLYLQRRSNEQPLPTSAEKMLGSHQAMGFAETNARRSVRGGDSELRLAEGTERVFALAYGRSAVFDGGTLRFDPFVDAPAGHALLMVPPLEGETMELSVKVRMVPREESLIERLRRFLVGSKARPSAGLLLVGSEDRYVALTASTEEPVTLEWSLGERRGRTLLDQSTTTDQVRLGLRIGSDGKLMAHAMIGESRSPIGEPLSLGPHWRRHFSLSAPLPGLGCVDGSCVFEELRYQFENPPPKPPPPPRLVPPPEPPRPRAVKRTGRTTKRRSRR